MPSSRTSNSHLAPPSSYALSWLERWSNRRAAPQPGIVSPMGAGMKTVIYLQ